MGTGAQARVPAIAISGLGAELSRHTLNPPVTKEHINEWVFNWIPDRDYIARLGGRPRQHQERSATRPLAISLVVTVCGEVYLRSTIAVGQTVAQSSAVAFSILNTLSQNLLETQPVPLRKPVMNRNKPFLMRLDHLLHRDGITSEKCLHLRERNCI